MNRRGYLAVIGSVLLAGCSSGNSATTNTNTPRSTPPPTQSLDDVEFPDGVTEDSITTELLTTHQQVVIGEPYTIEWQSVTGDRVRQTTTKIGTNKVHQEQVGTGTSSKSFYKDGSVGYASANEGEYYFETSSSIDRANIAQIYNIRDHLESGNYAPTVAVQGDDRLLIQAEATDASVGERLQQRSIDSIESYSASLQIAPSGQIVQWSYEWEFTRDGRTSSEELTYITRDIGATTVSEPGWLATARDQAYTFTLRAPENGSNYVAIDIEGGGSGLPSNFYAQISNQGQVGGKPVDIPIGDGDTIYLALVQDGIRISKQPDFSGAQELEGTVRVHFEINGVSVLKNPTVTV